MITRRTLLGTAMAATATGLYAPRVRAAEPDTLRFANSAGGPRKLDPNQITQGADSWAAAQVFEYLAQPADGDFGKTPDEFEPWLAESWTTSDDARTWVFTLRQGVQFHGGYGEMTSEDVARSFIRARDEGVDSSNYENIVSAEPSGKYEVTVTLKNPDPLFLGSTVFTRRTMIISKKAEQELGEAFTTQDLQIKLFRPVGHGDIIIDAHVVNRSKSTGYIEAEWRNSDGKLLVKVLAWKAIRTVEAIHGRGPA